MKHKSDPVDVALSTIVDQPSQPRLSPRMIWLRGMALERQRAARRSLLLTRILSAATFVSVLVAGVLFVPATTAITNVADQTAAAACAIFILGYTALQLIRSPR